MLYRVFKWLFYLTVKGYFRSIHIEGRMNIPNTCPVIFVANHNSAFMDPILLGVHIKRPVYFLARGESFKSKLVSILYGWLHMIPIYKPDISPDEVHKNKEIFERCFDHLAQRKTIMIFPEGISKTERKLRRIKTGAARIVLGAEAQHDFKLGVKIVPIGINYSNPHSFRSDVFVNFGAPIELDEYKNDYDKDPIKTVQALTGGIKAQLEQMIVIVKDQSIVKLVNNIERFYRNTLREELPEQHKASQDFYLSREIVKGVTYYKENRPVETLKFEDKIEIYFQKLDRLNLSDVEFRDPKQYSRSLWKISMFILGFPVFFYGFLVNIIPYQSVAFLSKQIHVREDFIGSIKLALGMFVFLIFYTIQAVIFTYFTNLYWGFVFALTFYPSGLYAVNYINQWYRFQGHLSYLRLKSNKKVIFRQLQAMRKDLLVELDEGRNLYLNASGK